MISRTGTTPGKYTVCTSGTHPSSPAVGDSIYETDTGFFKQWVGATDGWCFPWGSPWGRIADAQVTANQGSITTIVDLTSATVTFTALANRRYHIYAQCLPQSTVADDSVSLSITDGSNNVLNRQDSGAIHTATTPTQLQCQALVNPGAGSVTYKLRMNRAAGSGTVTNNAVATIPTFIIVEDIGPAGNPS